MPMTRSETVLDADVLTGAVAFTDICGFTEFTAVRGDRDALLLLGTQERLVRGCLPDGARVVKELGDGLLLWFPEADVGADDDPACCRTSSRPSRPPPSCRCGCASACTGVRRPERGDDLIGHDVNIASRVADVAGPTEVVVTDQLLSPDPAV